MTIRCVYCNNAVDPASPQTWRLMVGWERKAGGASRRSGSDIALRRARDKFACDTCIRRLKRGISPKQESLL